MIESVTISDTKSPAPDTTDLPDEHLRLLDKLVDGSERFNKSDRVVNMLVVGRFISRKHDLRDGSAVYILNPEVRDQMIARRARKAKAGMSSLNRDERLFLTLFATARKHGKMPLSVYLAGRQLAASGILTSQRGRSGDVELFRIRKGCREAIEEALDTELVREKVPIDLNKVSPSGNRGSGA